MTDENPSFLDQVARVKEHLHRTGKLDNKAVALLVKIAVTPNRGREELAREERGNRDLERINKELRQEARREPPRPSIETLDEVAIQAERADRARRVIVKRLERAIDEVERTQDEKQTRSTFLDRCRELVRTGNTRSHAVQLLRHHVERLRGHYSERATELNSHRDRDQSREI